IELDAERRALDVVEAFDAVVVLRPVELESMARAVPTSRRRVGSCGLAPRIIARPENRRGDRLRPGGAPGLRADCPEPEVDPELRVSGRVAEVCPAGELVLPVVVDRAFVAVVVAAEEVAKLVSPTA